jgi:hypothetical protein
MIWADLLMERVKSLSYALANTLFTSLNLNVEGAFL